MTTNPTTETIQENGAEINIPPNLPPRSRYPVLAEVLKRKKGECEVQFGSLMNDPLTEEEKSVYYKLIFHSIHLRVGQTVDIPLCCSHICIHKKSRTIWEVCNHKKNCSHS